MNTDCRTRLDALLAANKISPQQHEQMLAEFLSLNQVKVAVPSGSFSGLSLTQLFVQVLTFVTLSLILFLMTPYTHQLDEIKTSLLYILSPVLLLLAIAGTDWKNLLADKSRTLLMFALLPLVTVISFLLGDTSWLLAEPVMWFQIACFSFTFVFISQLPTLDRIRAAFRGFQILGLITASIGLIMYAGGLSGLHQWMKTFSPETFGSWPTLIYILNGSGYMYSTILSSDLCAIFFALLIPLTWAGALSEFGKWRMLSIISAIMITAALVLTRIDYVLIATAFVSGPIFLWLMQSARGRNDASAPALRVVAPVYGLIGLLTMTALISAFAYPLDRNPGPLTGVSVLWEGAVLIWLYGNNHSLPAINWNSVLFGTGPGGFRTHFPLFRAPDYFDHQINTVTTHSHSYPLDWLCEFGLAGFAVALVFLILMFRDGVRFLRVSTVPSARILQVGILTGIACALVIGWTSNAFRWTVDGVFLWSLIGLSLALSRTLKTPERVAVQSHFAPSGQMMKLRWVYPAVACAGLCFLLRSLPFGMDYYKSAVENGYGLRSMDSAEVGSLPHVKAAHLESSRRHFEAAIRLNPAFVTSYYKLAHVHNMLGQAEESIQTYRSMQKIDPHYSEVHVNLGIMLQLQARESTGTRKLALLEEAVVEGREAARQSLKPHVQMTTGAMVRELGDLKKAAGDMVEARSLYQEATRYYTNIIRYEPRFEELKADKAKCLPKVHNELRELKSQMVLLASGSNSDQTASLK